MCSLHEHIQPRLYLNGALPNEWLLCTIEPLYDWKSSRTVAIVNIYRLNSWTEECGTHSISMEYIECWTHEKPIIIYIDVYIAKKKAKREIGRNRKKYQNHDTYIQSHTVEWRDLMRSKIVNIVRIQYRLLLGNILHGQIPRSFNGIVLNRIQAVFRLSTRPGDKGTSGKHQFAFEIIASSSFHLIHKKTFKLKLSLDFLLMRCALSSLENLW